MQRPMLRSIVARVAGPRGLALAGAIALVAIAPADASAQSAKERPMRRVEVRRAVTPTVSLRLVGAFASLRVIGWAHDSVVITGSVPADARFESAWSGQGGVASPGGKAYLEVPEHEGRALPAGTLELRVPERARLWVKGGSATIDATGVQGGLDLAIVGGAIRVTGSPRELRADAMDGSITVVGSPAWMRAKTAAGTISVRGGSDDASLSTVTGALQVGAGRWDRLRLETVAGPVTFAGDLARGASVDVDSHGGAVELRLPTTLPVELDLATVTGRIENLWNERRPIPGREGRGMELGLTTHGGGARLGVRTFKGTIRLTRR